MDSKVKFKCFIFHPILKQFLQEDYYGLLMDHKEFAILSNLFFFFYKLLSFDKKKTKKTPINLNNSCPFLYHT